MNHFLRTLFFALVVRPLMMIILGTNIRRQELLPESGPAIIVANHNSHLDVFALMNVLGLRRLRHVRPVAAADYFMTRPLRRWFATRIVGIIPIDRKKVRREDGKHPLDPISEVINDGGIVLLFPEGSRGEPENDVGAAKRCCPFGQAASRRSDHTHLYAWTWKSIAKRRGAVGAVFL